MSNSEFEQLFKTYYPALCIYAEGILHDYHQAQDVVEDVFVKLLSSDTDTIKQMGGFLYRATRNACIDHIRKRRIVTEELSADFAHLHGEDGHIDSEALKIEVFRELAEALDQLSPRSGQIVKLAYMEGLASKEIASKLNVTVSTVDNTKAKALAKLRKLLSKRAFSLLLSGGMWI